MGEQTQDKRKVIDIPNARAPTYPFSLLSMQSFSPFSTLTTGHYLSLPLRLKGT